MTVENMLMEAQRASAERWSGADPWKRCEWKQFTDAMYDQVADCKTDTPVAAATAVSKYAGEARPHGIAEHSATTESDLAEYPVEEAELAEFSAEGVSSWPRADDTPTAATAAVAKFTGEARPPRIAQHCVKTESELNRVFWWSWATLVQSRWNDQRHHSGSAKRSVTAYF